MNRVILSNELTPVEKHNNILFKREDLFIPYEENGVNGGKVRQCIYLLNKYAQDKHVYTYSSLNAPSSPIIAAVCREMWLPCTIYYGGTNIKSIMKNHMPRLASYYDAELNLDCKSGRHTVLHHAVSQILTKNDFLAEFETNIQTNYDALIDAVANQVENIPNNLNNLVATCGSGITAAGILIGLVKFNKQVNNIIFVTTAPDRTKRIKELLSHYKIDINFITLDLYHEPTFNYDKRENFIFDNITLHPNYEAKTLKAFLNSDFNKENTLFWIIGSEPTLDLTFI